MSQTSSLRAATSELIRAVSAPQYLTVATYNLHGWVGTDGCREPERALAVLQELHADLIALQEVECCGRESEPEPLCTVAAVLGMSCVFAPTRVREGGGGYGNALLLRNAVVRAHKRVDLSVPGREPRLALIVNAGVDGVELSIVATHLGLSRRERAAQLSRLLPACPPPVAHPTLVLGDINEWLPRTGARLALDKSFGAVAHGATFPARLPLLRLDGIWAAPRAAVVDACVHDSPLVRRASDHRPVVAVVSLAAMRAHAAVNEASVNEASVSAAAVGTQARKTG